jgi:hypothetical protein
MVNPYIEGITNLTHGHRSSTHKAISRAWARQIREMDRECAWGSPRGQRHLLGIIIVYSSPPTTKGSVHHPHQEAAESRLDRITIVPIFPVWLVAVLFVMELRQSSSISLIRKLGNLRAAGLCPAPARLLCHLLPNPDHKRKNTVSPAMCHRIRHRAWDFPNRRKESSWMRPAFSDRQGL